MIVRRLSLIALLGVPWIVAFLTPQPTMSPPALLWWTTHALDKIRPDRAPPEALQYDVRLFAARNEFEPFQIVLRAESQTIEDVDLQPSSLKGPAGAVIPEKNITIYLEKFIDLAKATPGGGATGEWPDALIPRVDRYAGEKRNAFPFRLQDRRNQPIWIDVYVPPDTPPGTYVGSITITAAEARKAVIPVSVHVWPFTLPSTSSFPTTFGFSGISAARQHFGRYTTDEAMYELTRIYGKALLWHRISMYGGSMTPPAVVKAGDGVMHIRWDRYDDEVGPLLDGTAIAPGEPLYGAKATTVDLRMWKGLQRRDEKIAYLREFTRHFREKGWLDRLFNYLRDEPVPSDYAAMLADGEIVHTADPSLKNLVTAPLHPGWSSVIDIWSPLINCFEDKLEQHFCDPIAGRDDYAGELAKGKKLWWYQSCSSHGCGTVRGKGLSYFQGWPTYVIDSSGVANRIMPWEAWKYHIGGELYFSTNEAFAGKSDPWSDVFLFNGNGEGTLLYPGEPSKIGGRTDIPIESIRLKLIREGLEDYEYLHMLDQKGESKTAAAIAGTLVRRTYDFDDDPAALYAARQRMGEELNARH
jgi:hypothetical protein